MEEDESEFQLMREHRQAKLEVFLADVKRERKKKEKEHQLSFTQETTTKSSAEAMESDNNGTIQEGFKGECTASSDYVIRNLGKFYELLAQQPRRHTEEQKRLEAKSNLTSFQQELLSLRQKYKCEFESKQREKPESGCIEETCTDDSEPDSNSTESKEEARGEDSISNSSSSQFFSAEEDSPTREKSIYMTPEESTRKKLIAQDMTCTQQMGVIPDNLCQPTDDHEVNQHLDNPGIQNVWYQNSLNENAFSPLPPVQIVQPSCSTDKETEDEPIPQPVIYVNPYVGSGLCGSVYTTPHISVPPGFTVPCSSTARAVPPPPGCATDKGPMLSPTAGYGPAQSTAPCSTMPDIVPLKSDTQPKTLKVDFTKVYSSIWDITDSDIEEALREKQESHIRENRGSESTQLIDSASVYILGESVQNSSLPAPANADIEDKPEENSQGPLLKSERNRIPHPPGFKIPITCSPKKESQIGKPQPHNTQQTAESCPTKAAPPTILSRILARNEARKETFFNAAEQKQQATRRYGPRRAAARSVAENISTPVKHKYGPKAASRKCPTTLNAASNASVRCVDCEKAESQKESHECLKQKDSINSNKDGFRPQHRVRFNSGNSDADAVPARHKYGPRKMHVVSQPEGQACQEVTSNHQVNSLPGKPDKNSEADISGRPTPGSRCRIPTRNGVNKPGGPKTVDDETACRAMREGDNRPQKRPTRSPFSDNEHPTGPPYSNNERSTRPPHMNNQQWPQKPSYSDNHDRPPRPRYSNSYKRSTRSSIPRFERMREMQDRAIKNEKLPAPVPGECRDAESVDELMVKMKEKNVKIRERCKVVEDDKKMAEEHLSKKYSQLCYI